jgi:hypothetical protein
MPTFVTGQLFLQKSPAHCRYPFSRELHAKEGRFDRTLDADDATYLMLAP